MLRGEGRIFQKDECPSYSVTAISRRMTPAVREDWRAYMRSVSRKLGGTDFRPVLLYVDRLIEKKNQEFKGFFVFYRWGTVSIPQRSRTMRQHLSL